MPGENVELVRRFYAALNANDLGSVRTLCDDPIEYVNPDAATEPGTRTGPEAFRAAFEGIHDSFNGFRCEPETITPFDDAVVVVARSTGAGRMSDIKFSEARRALAAPARSRRASGVDSSNQGWLPEAHFCPALEGLGRVWAPVGVIYAPFGAHTPMAVD